MATERVLLVEADGLADPVKAQILKSANPPSVVPLADGARCVSAFAKLARAKQPPLLVVLSDDLPRIGMLGVALAIRAIERGLGIPQTALLVYTRASADVHQDALKAIGRAIHLQRPAGLSPADETTRLCKAIGQLLTQIRGA